MHIYFSNTPRLAPGCRQSRPLPAIHRPAQGLHARTCAVAIHNRAIDAHHPKPVSSGAIMRIATCTMRAAPSTPAGSSITYLRVVPHQQQSGHGGDGSRTRIPRLGWPLLQNFHVFYFILHVLPSTGSESFLGRRRRKPDFRGRSPLDKAPRRTKKRYAIRRKHSGESAMVAHSSARHAEPSGRCSGMM